MVDTYRIGRCISAFSDEELENRRAAAQKYMAANNLDAIFIMGHEPKAGGAMRYFMDFPSDLGRYCAYGIIPREGEYAIFSHGPFQQKAQPHVDRGIALNFAAPYSHVWEATKNFCPPAAVDWLELHGYKKFGICHKNMVSFRFVDYIMRKIEGATLISVDDGIDSLRASKSDVEIALHKYAAEIHDKIFAAIPGFLKPGRLERDVATDIKKLSWDLGSDMWTVNVGSDAKKAANLFYEMQNREIEAGDVVCVHVQVSEPGGYWGTLSRMFIVGGEPSAELKKASADSLKIQAELAALAKPGVAPVELREALLKFQEENGYKIGSGFFAHGQGTDPIERPAAEEGETFTFEENNILAIYPALETDDVYVLNGDNYIVTKDGAVRLNQTAQGIIRV